jgi:hypothetical protein
MDTAHPLGHAVHPFFANGGLGTGGSAVEVRAPHAQHTGQGRAFQVIQGRATGVESIAADEVYVEFAATGSAQADVVKTIVPWLPSTVPAQLDGDPDPHATLGNLPFRRLVVEADTKVGPVKLMWDTATARLTAADIPHFSKFSCLRVALAAGVNANTAGRTCRPAGTPGPSRSTRGSSASRSTRCTS